MPNVTSGRFLLFDGTETRFHTVRLRSKNANCVICGECPVIHELIDYEEFCGAKANDKEPNLDLLKKEERITVEEFDRTMKTSLEPRILIDVRSSEEYQLCRLEDSINIPFIQLTKDHNIKLIRDNIKKLQKDHYSSLINGNVYSVYDV